VNDSLSRCQRPRACRACGTDGPVPQKFFYTPPRTLCQPLINRLMLFSFLHLFCPLEAPPPISSIQSHPRSPRKASACSLMPYPLCESLRSRAPLRWKFPSVQQDNPARGNEAETAARSLMHLDRPAALENRPPTRAPIRWSPSKEGSLENRLPTRAPIRWSPSKEGSL
jgi:hypothetical protein